MRVRRVNVQWLLCVPWERRSEAPFIGSCARADTRSYWALQPRGCRPRPRRSLLLPWRQAMRVSAPAPLVRLSAFSAVLRLLARDPRSEGAMLRPADRALLAALARLLPPPPAPWIGGDSCLWVPEIQIRVIREAGAAARAPDR
jgi:hypothetical protein